jgi:hypothetical protein
VDERDIEYGTPFSPRDDTCPSGWELRSSASSEPPHYPHTQAMTGSKAKCPSELYQTSHVHVKATYTLLLDTKRQLRYTMNTETIHTCTVSKRGAVLLQSASPQQRTRNTLPTWPLERHKVLSRLPSWKQTCATKINLPAIYSCRLLRSERLTV